MKESNSNGKNTLNADKILSLARRIERELIEFRREVHSVAEVGFNLKRTCRLIEEALGDYDCEIRKVGRSGIVTSLGSGDGRTMLLRADMDALPIREESGVTFASHNGNMHACGHDIHAAMLLGAFKILFKFKDKIQGRVLFCFQPAEETLEGARDMISAGLLDGGVDLALMLHVILGTDFPTGYTIVASEGVCAPSSDFFKITVRGKSAHGSTPHLSKNALACAARVILSIEELPAREFSVSDDVVVSVGRIECGEAANIIPDTAVIYGTARAYSEEVRAALKSRIESIAKGLCAIYGLSCDMEITSSCPTLVNDKEASERLLTFTRELLGSEMCIGSDKLGTRGGGSEDFAYISQRVPSVMASISAGSRSEGYEYPIHNSYAVFDERVISTGAAVLAYSALRYFEEN